MMSGVRCVPPVISTVPTRVLYPGSRTRKVLSREGLNQNATPYVCPCSDAGRAVPGERAPVSGDAIVLRTMGVVFPVPGETVHPVTVWTASGWPVTVVARNPMLIAVQNRRADISHDRAMHAP